MFLPLGSCFMLHGEFMQNKGSMVSCKSSAMGLICAHKHLPCGKRELVQLVQLLWNCQISIYGHDERFVCA